MRRRLVSTRQQGRRIRFINHQLCRDACVSVTCFQYLKTAAHLVINNLEQEHDGGFFELIG